MNKLFKTFFLNHRFFYILGGISSLMVIAFFIPFVFWVSIVLLSLLLIITLFDAYLLYADVDKLEAKRIVPERLSNGDDNRVNLHVSNPYPFKVLCQILEELPIQFQKRDASFDRPFLPNESVEIKYSLYPTKRGDYDFGHTNVFVMTSFGLVKRKFTVDNQASIRCFPSFLRLNELMNNITSRINNQYGNKKTRRIGHSLEFEQIKGYVAGDDIRTINWKATAKANHLMVNQYMEETSQAFYSIIDKGRAMQMSFNDMTLLDYAINSTLATSHVVLRKHDRAGMMTFSKDIEDVIVADQRPSQMRLISETLYNVKTNFHESSFDRLYAMIRKKVTHRSIMLMYTNFETLDSLHRQLPYIRAIAKNHMLIVVFFKNVELYKLTKNKAANRDEVYDKIIAEKFLHEKELIVHELKKYGIHSILTEPQYLSAEVINKYIELKSKGI